MTVFVQHKRNSAILKPVKEAFRADMVTLRWEGNSLLFKSFVAGWKTVCGACKRAVYLCFLGCAEMRRPLLTELSAAGLLGVAVDKVTRCVAIPALLAVWEWRRQVGVSCAAKSSVSSLLCKKDCSTWVLPSIAVLFVYSTLSVIAALCRFPLRPSCEKAAQPSPQAWLSCKIKCNSLNYAQSEAERI